MTNKVRPIEKVAKPVQPAKPSWLKTFLDDLTNRSDRFKVFYKKKIAPVSYVGFVFYNVFGFSTDWTYFNGYRTSSKPFCHPERSIADNFRMGIDTNAVDASYSMIFCMLLFAIAFGFLIEFYDIYRFWCALRSRVKNDGKKRNLISKFMKKFRDEVDLEESLADNPAFNVYYLVQLLKFAKSGLSTLAILLGLSGYSGDSSFRLTMLKAMFQWVMILVSDLPSLLKWFVRRIHVIWMLIWYAASLTLCGMTISFYWSAVQRITIPLTVNNMTFVGLCTNDTLTNPSYCPSSCPYAIPSTSNITAAEKANLDAFNRQFIRTMDGDWYSYQGGWKADIRNTYACNYIDYKESPPSFMNNISFSTNIDNKWVNFVYSQPQPSDPYPIMFFIGGYFQAFAVNNNAFSKSMIPLMMRTITQSSRAYQIAILTGKKFILANKGLDFKAEPVTITDCFDFQSLVWTDGKQSHNPMGYSQTIVCVSFSFDTPSFAQCLP